MAINYSTTVKNARLLAVKTALLAGSGAPKLRIFSATYTTMLVEIALDDPMADPTGGVLALFDDPKTGVAAAGAPTNAALARLTDSDNNMIAEGLTVGLTGSGANVILDAISITAGQNVTINSAEITHAA
jgi:hypothetical protein